MKAILIIFSVISISSCAPTAVVLRPNSTRVVVGRANVQPTPRVVVRPRTRAIHRHRCIRRF